MCRNRLGSGTFQFGLCCRGLLPAHLGQMKNNTQVSNQFLLNYIILLQCFLFNYVKIFVVFGTQKWVRFFTVNSGRKWNSKTKRSSSTKEDEEKNKFKNETTWWQIWGEKKKSPGWHVKRNDRKEIQRRSHARKSLCVCMNSKGNAEKNYPDKNLTKNHVNWLCGN